VRALDGRNDRGERGQLRVDGPMNWPVSPYINPHFEDFPGGWQATHVVWNCLPPEGTPHPARTWFRLNCPETLNDKILAN
jgi:hypothetical protein